MSRSPSDTVEEQPAEHRPERGAAPDAAQIRFRVDPANVPPEKAARRLHLTPQQFTEVLPRLLARGFPPADPDTGMYDLEAIDRRRAARHRPDPVPVALTFRPEDPQSAATGGMAERSIAAKNRCWTLNFTFCGLK
ncbi:hypothetical protein [Bradyrhizobium sp. AZCC 1678]|uniref:hypothetical protein n=1 Tax=Bradyrhizobium sp. AZCC 1678 TaxID=3117030 RepID=UPI002FEF40A2